MDELITYLRDKTHMTRFSRGEIREVIERMGADGWEIVRKDDGSIVETPIVIVPDDGVLSDPLPKEEDETTYG